MQKSVLIPIEKYERLLKNVSKETRDVGTETSNPETAEEKSSEEQPKPSLVQASVEEKEAALAPQPEKKPSEVSESEDFKTLPPKKRRRSRPPGIKDYKSVWLKLNGRL